jgi:hypothetical protein
VPLSTLKQELDTYLANLKNKVCLLHAGQLHAGQSLHAATLDRLPSVLALCPQLVEVINEDYGDYVSLSSRLVNVDGSVIRMRRPLLDLKVRRPAAQLPGWLPGWPAGRPALSDSPRQGPCAAGTGAAQLCRGPRRGLIAAAAACAAAGEAAAGAGGGQGGAGHAQPGGTLPLPSPLQLQQLLRLAGRRQGAQAVRAGRGSQVAGRRRSPGSRAPAAGPAPPQGGGGRARHAGAAAGGGARGLQGGQGLLGLPRLPARRPAAAQQVLQPALQPEHDGATRQSPHPPPSPAPWPRCRQVEKLLEEMEAGLAAGQGDLDGSSRMLERVAGEVSRLSFLANRGKVRQARQARLVARCGAAPAAQRAGGGGRQPSGCPGAPSPRAPARPCADPP